MSTRDGFCVHHRGCEAVAGIVSANDFVLAVEGAMLQQDLNFFTHDTGGVIRPVQMVSCTMHRRRAPGGIVGTPPR